jgi:alkane 1-monooxygenase
MKLNKLKYLLVYTLPAATAVSFLSEGVWSWTAVFYAFGLLPILDHFLIIDKSNLSAQQESKVLQLRIFDVLLYMVVPVHLAMVGWFFFEATQFTSFDLTAWGKIFSLGAMSSVTAINVAHEIGHRNGQLNKITAKTLLTTVLYSHFYEEHNFGHHRNVATYDDPATARRGEWVYVFFFRSVVMGLVSAFRIESKRIKRKGVSVISFQNGVLVWQLIQVGLVVAVYFSLGWLVAVGFGLYSLIAVFILESINYVEHYGLVRKKESEFRYEKVKPHHSWNADNSIGRAVLFELTRHSDHHENPHKKFQVLRTPRDVPELPTGYPGMVLLTLVPPIYFQVMKSRLENWCKTFE